jgi:hypothetical protein
MMVIMVIGYDGGDDGNSDGYGHDDGDDGNDSNR